MQHADRQGENPIGHVARLAEEILRPLQQNFSQGVDRRADQVAQQRARLAGMLPATQEISLCPARQQQRIEGHIADEERPAARDQFH